MDDKILKPTVIEEIPFPSGTQETQQVVGGSDNNEIKRPTEVQPRTFPVLNIATGLKSSTFDTETRTIAADYSFTEYGAISIGKFSPGVSGDIRLSPSGILARNKDGRITFSIDGNTGNLITDGYIQVGGAASDVNSGVTTISAGKVLISGATTVASWSSGSDATYIDGAKLYTGSVTATKISVSQLDALCINTGTLTVDELITVGLSNIKIDGANRRILVNDGTYDRVLIGLF